MSTISNEEVHGLLSRIDERTEFIQDRVDKLAHVVLEGNGTPALTVTVAQNAVRLDALEDHIERKQIPAHVWVSIIASGVIALVVLALQIYAKVG